MLTRNVAFVSGVKTQRLNKFVCHVMFTRVAATVTLQPYHKATDHTHSTVPPRKYVWMQPRIRHLPYNNPAGKRKLFEARWDRHNRISTGCSFFLRCEMLMWRLVMRILLSFVYVDNFPD